MRLPVGDVIRRNEFFRERKAGCPDANFRQGAGAGGHDRPAIVRQARQQFQRPGQGNNALEVRDFAPLHLPVFSLVVGIRKILLHGR